MIVKEKWDNESNDPTIWVNPLQLITTLHKEGFIDKLMYVLLLVNVMDVKAMIDTWVTHNYLASMKATRLELNLEEDVTRIKPLNGNDQRVDGIARNINLKVGYWKGYFCMLMVPLEDFNIVRKIRLIQPMVITLEGGE